MNKCKKATISKNLLNKKITIIKVNVNKQSYVQKQPFESA